ncbi:hypothetical protein CHS0354_006778 [Potamilus streckersoni]|uniref:Uncharacterized protein n=1 Tax=Potamilus streckersoni TaxID=2493646 RepID=A0AAE0S816_9BIVA|nr:hypothetical protein CHS0354_006778 [Potamilus streckersoni]
MADDKNLFSKTLFHLARSLGALKPTPWEKVMKLLSLLPAESPQGTLTLDQRGQDAVVAVGMYFLKSDLQHKDQILPSLLGVLKALPKATWVDNPKGMIKHRLPAPECFSFSLNTILSDVAHRDEASRGMIIATQMEVMQVLADVCEGSFQVSNETLCRATVPILLGMARAIGRSSDDQKPFISVLYSLDKEISLPVLDEAEPFKKSFTTFRSILPRTLSSHVITPDSPSTPSAHHAIEFSEYYRRERSPSPKAAATRISFAASDTKIDPKVHYFNKVGSSFTHTKPWGFEIIPEQDHLKFDVSHLQALLALAKRLLKKELLESLDSKLDDMFTTSENGHMVRFAYKTFSEAVTLVIVTLLRDVLEQAKDVPGRFMKEVEVFIKSLYMVGQQELDRRRHSQYHQHSRDSYTAGDKKWDVNPYELMVCSSAACVDLLFWAVREESGSTHIHKYESFIPLFDTRYESFIPLFDTRYESFIPLFDTRYESFIPLFDTRYESFIPLFDTRYEAFIPLSDTRYEAFIPLFDTRYESFIPLFDTRYEAFIPLFDTRYEAFIPLFDTRYESFIPLFDTRYEAFIPLFDTRYEAFIPLFDTRYESFIPLFDTRYEAFIPLFDTRHEAFIPLFDTRYESFIPLFDTRYESFIPLFDTRYESFIPLFDTRYESFIPLFDTRYEAFIPLFDTRYKAFIPLFDTRYESFIPLFDTRYESFIPLFDTRYESFIPLFDTRYEAFIPLFDTRYEAFIPLFDTRYESFIPLFDTRYESFIPLFDTRYESFIPLFDTRYESFIPLFDTRYEAFIPLFDTRYEAFIPLFDTRYESFIPLFDTRYESFIPLFDTRYESFIPLFDTRYEAFIPLFDIRYEAFIPLFDTRYEPFTLLLGTR